MVHQKEKQFVCVFFSDFHCETRSMVVHQTSGNLCLCPQMPRVMDSNSQGIDLHFWGQALRGLSGKIQLVSHLKQLLHSLLSSRPPSLTPASIFSAAGNPPLPLLPV